MAASKTDRRPSDAAPAPATPARQPRLNASRVITPQAGHALEILGHAIEYLTDEFVHHGTAMFNGNGQLEAIQLLMSLNRQVYFECPEVPTIGQRLRSLLRLHPASWQQSGS